MKKRAQPNKSARPYLVTDSAMRRINRAVAAFERGDRNIQPPPLPRAWDGDGGGIRIGKIDCDWPVGECVTVTIWESGENCTPTENSPAETVEDVRNLSRDVKAQSWVAIGQAADGRWYLVEASGPQTECRQTIGGEDFTKWPGWQGNAVQLLGHDESGCLRWFDVNSCDTGSGS